jgi:hypothetical protein
MPAISDINAFSSYTDIMETSSSSLPILLLSKESQIQGDNFRYLYRPLPGMKLKSKSGLKHQFSPDGQLGIQPEKWNLS